MAAHQRITQDWWENLRGEFDLFASQAVTREAAGGDPAAAARRLEALKTTRLVDINAEAEELAGWLIRSGIIPTKAAEDALHIALATVHGMDYLLTWNCKHIANAALREAMASLLLAQGYRCPVICTPEELMEV